MGTRNHCQSKPLLKLGENTWSRCSQVRHYAAQGGAHQRPASTEPFSVGDALGKSCWQEAQLGASDRNLETRGRQTRKVSLTSHCQRELSSQEPANVSGWSCLLLKNSSPLMIFWQHSKFVLVLNRVVALKIQCSDLLLLGAWLTEGPDVAPLDPPPHLISGYISYERSWPVTEHGEDLGKPIPGMQDCPDGQFRYKMSH